VKVRKGTIQEIAFASNTRTVNLSIKQDNGTFDYVDDYDRAKTSSLANIFGDLLTPDEELSYAAKIIGKEIFYWLNESGKFLSGIQLVKETPRDEIKICKKKLKQALLEIE